MTGINLGGRAFTPPVVPYSRWDGTDEFGDWVTQTVYAVPRTGGLAGAAAMQLTSSPPNVDVNPEASPDGLRVLFSRNGADLRVVNVTTLAETFLVNFDEGSTFGGTNSRHRWKPDGTRIVYADVEQFPSRGTLYSLASDGSELPVMLKQWTPGVSIGDFGYAYDGSVIVFRDPATGTLWTVEDDGSNATDTGLAIAAPLGFAYGNRITPGHVSDLVVYLDTVANEIRKCALDGTGDTLVEAIGANNYRFSNHILSDDDSTVMYVYDSNNYNNNDGWFTSEIGKDSEIFAVPVDGSGQVSTGVWVFTEYAGGNLGNNPVDVPHALNGRFYTSYNDQATGGDYPNGDVSHYKFGSFALDGSDGRVEDEFDISGPEPAEPDDAPWVRITFEEAIS